MIRLNTHIVKFIAVGISLIYMLMPLHTELKSALHGMSHYLEKPDLVMSHNHNENLSYGQETIFNSFHEHKIIDLLDCLTDSNTSNEDSSIPDLVDNKVDKHFFSSEYMEPILCYSQSIPLLDNYIHKIKEGFYRKIMNPPKVRNTQPS